MYTQRKKERRSFSGKTSFPLVTNGGYEVEKDRRSTQDRRLSNIHPGNLLPFGSDRFGHIEVAEAFDVETVSRYGQ